MNKIVRYHMRTRNRKGGHIKYENGEWKASTTKKNGERVSHAALDYSISEASFFNKLKIPQQDTRVFFSNPHNVEPYLQVIAPEGVTKSNFKVGLSKMRDAKKSLDNAYEKRKKEQERIKKLTPGEQREIGITDESIALHDERVIHIKAMLDHIEEFMKPYVAREATFLPKPKLPKIEIEREKIDNETNIKNMQVEIDRLRTKYIPASDCALIIKVYEETEALLKVLEKEDVITHMNGASIVALKEMNERKHQLYIDAKSMDSIQAEIVRLDETIAELNMDIKQITDLEREERQAIEKERQAIEKEIEREQKERERKEKRRIEIEEKLKIQRDQQASERELEREVDRVIEQNKLEEDIIMGEAPKMTRKQRRKAMEAEKIAEKQRLLHAEEEKIHISKLKTELKKEVIQKYDSFYNFVMKMPQNIIDDMNKDLHFLNDLITSKLLTAEQIDKKLPIEIQRLKDKLRDLMDRIIKKNLKLLTEENRQRYNLFIEKHQSSIDAGTADEIVKKINEYILSLLITEPFLEIVNEQIDRIFVEYKDLL